MKHFSGSLICISIILSCQTGFQESKEGPQSDTTGVENLIQVPSLKCYEIIEKGDTFKLTIDVYSDVVAGSLEYLYKNKPDVIGQLSGIRSGDTLIGDYVYTVDGKENARQVAFLIEDVFAKEGHGPMDEINGRKYFNDKSKLDFGKGINMLRQDCSNPESSMFSGLAGIWELSFLEDEIISLDSLYPVKKPHLQFTNGERSQFSGHTSCNNLRGVFEENGSQFRFKEPVSMTKMYCEGEGEKTFLQKIFKIDQYSIQEDELLFYEKGRVILRFSRK